MELSLKCVHVYSLIDYNFAFYIYFIEDENLIEPSKLDIDL